jgi:hypothetical protein
MLLLCNKEMKNDNINVPKNVENIIKYMYFIEGLHKKNIINDVMIKISDNLIMLKNEIFIGTVSTDKQKSKYTILGIFLSLLTVDMVYCLYCLF